MRQFFYFRVSMLNAKTFTIIWFLLLIALQTAFAQQVQYNYDAAGRLVSVTDAQGRTVTFEYDALGNRRVVRRQDMIGQVAITSVSPIQGFIGTQVQIVGFGFSAVANENAIAFNGVSAPVLAATTTSLTTQVPFGATTGSISVKAPLGSATSPQPFTVLGGITVSPSQVNVPRGTSQQFTVTVTGTTDQSVAWSVNGIVGGNSTIGTITADGLYTAPLISTTSAMVTIKATSLAFPGLPELSATASVTIIAVCSVTWTGGGKDNLWQNSANWNTKILPGSNDDVCIASGFTVVLSSGAQSIKSLTSDSALTITGGPSLSIASSSSINQGLTLSGGTLGGAGSVTISGSSTWNDGRMIDGGTTTFNGNLAISGGNNLTLSGGRTLNTTATTTVTLNPGTIQTGSATINNSGLWLDQSNSSSAVLAWNGFFGSLSTFNNTGTYRKTGATTSSISITFNNTSSGAGTGVVDLQSGTLNFSANGTASNGSSFTGASGTTFGFFGSFGSGTYNVNSSVNAATVAVNAGTVNFNGTYSASTTSVSGGTANFTPGTTVTAVGDLTIPGGTAAFNTGGLITPTTLAMTAIGSKLAGTDAVTVSGTTTWTGGTMTDSGTTTLNGNVTISGINGVSLSGGRILNTTATTTVLDAASISTGGGPTINNSGLWQDQTTGAVSINRNLERGVLLSTFRNTGTYRKTGAATTTISITFNNISPGVVDLQAGTLDLTGGGTETGNFATQPGATVLFSSGTFDFNNASAVGSVGSFRVNTTINVSGALTIGGLLDLAGGTLNITGAVTANSYNQTGTLSGTGALTVSGLTTWSSGTMTDAGTTTLNGNVTISGINGVSLSGGRILNTTATTTVLGATSISTGGGPTINNSGLWQDQTTGAASINQNLERGVLLSTFNNSGIYRKSVASSTSISIAFNNTSSGAGTGVVDLQSGTLFFNAGGTANSGSIFTGVTGTTLGFTQRTYTLSAGSSLSADAVTISGAGTINVNGTYGAAATSVGSTANFNSGATVTTVGALTISGGTVNFNTGGPIAATALNLSGVALTGTDTVTVSGSTTWNSGSMTGTGTTTVNGNLTITGGQSADLTAGRTLNANATTTVLGVGSIRTSAGASINNSGLWQDQSTSAGQFTNFSGAQSTFNNTGTYQKSVGTAATSISIIFTNSGTVEIQSGSLAFSGGYTQTDGETKLNGGALSSTTTLNIQGGKLSGAGTVTANVSNAGQVNPGASPGILNITGTYTQTSAGRLNIEIGGLTAGTQYDRLAISGSATLSGTLNVSLIGGFVPNPGDSFQIMTFGSRTGTFTTTNGLDLGGGRSLQVNYNATNVTLVTPP